MRKTKVLIVEDEIIIVRGLEEIIEGPRFTVCGFALSGKKAIELAAKLKPHLALVDIFLQGNMDGIELAGILTSRYRIPVIYITAYADRKILERATAGNPFGYIVKPVRESQLRASLDLAVQRIKAEEKRDAVCASHLRTIGELQERLMMRTDEFKAASRKLDEVEGAFEEQRLKLDELRKEFLELNGVLFTLTRRMERARDEAALEIGAAIRSRIVPMLRDLEAGCAFHTWRADLDMLLVYLNQLLPGISTENHTSPALSIMELRVATLIKNGLTSEQIAQQLHLSPETIKTHRRNIRKKLNLQNTETNLAGYLKSI